VRELWVCRDCRDFLEAMLRGGTSWNTLREYALDKGFILKTSFPRRYGGGGRRWAQQEAFPLCSVHERVRVLLEDSLKAAGRQRHNGVGDPTPLGLLIERVVSHGSATSHVPDEGATPA